MICGLLALAALSCGFQSSETTDLVLFVAPGRSEVGRAFQDEVLPQLRASAEQASMTLRVVNIGDGAPPEVTITPLLFHQGAGGRSVYQGRWNNLQRMESFLKTSRFVVQDSEPWVRTHLPVQHDGRAQVLAPCKITALTGDLPEGHDPAAFEKRARAAIYGGFKSFAVEPSIEFGRSDRAFYLDFYPHVAGDEIYVSMALFSMFHCKEALWRTGEAVSGPFTDLEAVFRRAVELGEAAIAEQRKATESGDGFDAVPESVPLLSWEALGLQLPPAPVLAEGETRTIGIKIEDLPLDWQFAVGDQEASKGLGSAIRFHFAPPLDGTAGEVGQARGSFHFAQPGSLQGASGEAECEAASVTLGWEDLDQTVHGESMLDVARYPQASFVLNDLRPQVEGASKLVFGRPVGVLAEGLFTMKGRELPISVRADLEPTLHESGAPRLSIDATFTLRLKEPFGILGPDGPAPAKDTLLFELSLLLKPANKSEREGR